MDKAHTATDTALYALERRLRRLYARTNKQIQEDIAPLLADIVLDKDDATQRQRLDYALRHGLSKIAELFADSMVETNEKAIRDINRTMLGVYGVNFSAMADFFREKAGIDIAKGD